jgi:hypothetical protein
MYGYYIYVFKLIFQGIIMLVLFYLNATIHKNCFILQCYVAPTSGQATSSEMLVPIYQAVWCHIPEQAVYSVTIFG